MAAAMTNVAVPADATWTLIYTAAGTITITVQPRSNSDVWVRVNGASGTTGDSSDAAAMKLRPFERMSMALASGDKVFARPDGDRLAARVTVLV